MAYGVRKEGESGGQSAESGGGDGGGSPLTESAAAGESTTAAAVGARASPAPATTLSEADARELQCVIDILREHAPCEEEGSAPGRLFDNNTVVAKWRATREDRPGCLAGRADPNGGLRFGTLVSTFSHTLRSHRLSNRFIGWNGALGTHQCRYWFAAEGQDKSMLPGQPDAAEELPTAVREAGARPSRTRVAPSRFEHVDKVSDQETRLVQLILLHAMLFSHDSASQPDFYMPLCCAGVRCEPRASAQPFIRDGARARWQEWQQRARAQQHTRSKDG